MREASRGEAGTVRTTRGAIVTTQQLLRPATPPPDVLTRRASLPAAGDVVCVDLPAGGWQRGVRTVRLRVIQAVWAHYHRGSNPYRRCWIDGQVVDAGGAPSERHVLLVRACEITPVTVGGATGRETPDEAS